MEASTQENEERSSHEDEERSRGVEPPRDEERSRGDEAPRDEERSRKPQESENEESEENQEKSSGSKLPGVNAIGWGFVLLILGGYFVWLCGQMGGGTALGAAPMIGVLVASVIGIAAAGIAFAVSRNDKGNER
jgi:hypothetical protein